jgi:hypothetical protein
MRLASAPSIGKDVITMLKEQHHQAKLTFERAVRLRGKELAAAFLDIQRLLLSHEAAEQAIVHPVAKLIVEDGEAIIAARLEEESALNEALAELRTLEVGSATFEHRLQALRFDVLSHARREERDELARLARLIDDGRLAQMTSAFRVAHEQQWVSGLALTARTPR